MNGSARIVLVAGGERTQLADLKQGGREGVEGSGIPALGALNGNAESQRGFGDAVVEQDYACNDLKQVTLDVVEDALDVMDEDHGVFEGVQLLGADAGAETESSEDAGQASDVNRHTEITAQQSAGVRTIGGQVGGVGLFAATGYEFQTRVDGAIVHACTSAHGAHSVRSLPARRSQIFPQRSQYFSSILRICNISDLAFIVLAAVGRR
jgi:hypothetical protein